MNNTQINMLFEMQMWQHRKTEGPDSQNGTRIKRAREI